MSCKVKTPVAPWDGEGETPVWDGESELWKIGSTRGTGSTCGKSERYKIGTPVWDGKYMWKIGTVLDPKPQTLSGEYLDEEQNIMMDGGPVQVTPHINRRPCGLNPEEMMSICL